MNLQNITIQELKQLKAIVASSQSNSKYFFGDKASIGVGFRLEGSVILRMFSEVRTDCALFYDLVQTFSKVAQKDQRR